jgi:hypothetical protein
MLKVPQEEKYSENNDTAVGGSLHLFRFSYKPNRYENEKSNVGGNRVDEESRSPLFDTLFSCKMCRPNDGVVSINIGIGYRAGW